MSEDRHVLRWLELSWCFPLPLSLGLVIWSVLMRPDPGTLALLLVLQMALMASACSVPASLAAGRSRIWWRRVAPGAFRGVVHRSWREHMLALLALGLLGPAAAATRAGAGGDWALVCWALALPLLGALCGTLAAWAWHGALPPAGLALGPAVAGAALAMSLTSPAWLPATPLALAALAATLLMLGWAWQASRRLQPRWAGVASVLRPARRRQPALQRWRYDALAFDDSSSNEAQGTRGLWSRYVPFLMLGFSGAAPLKAVMADEIIGTTSFHAALYLGFLLTFAATGLVVRVAHWRLQLAPRGPGHSRQLGLMLAESTGSLWAATAGVIGFHAWQQGLGLSELGLPLTRAALDAAFCVALAAAGRGLNNRGWVVMLGTLGLVVGAAAALWLLNRQGIAVPRGAPFLAGQAALTLALLGLTVLTWRQRVPRGMQQHPGSPGADR